MATLKLIKILYKDSNPSLDSNPSFVSQNINYMSFSIKTIIYLKGKDTHIHNNPSPPQANQHKSQLPFIGSTPYLTIMAVRRRNSIWVSHIGGRGPTN